MIKFNIVDGKIVTMVILISKNNTFLFDNRSKLKRDIQGRLTGEKAEIGSLSYSFQESAKE